MEESRIQRMARLLSETWPARMAKDAWQAVKLPGDVYQGNVPITGEDGRTNPEVINRAADLAGILMGGTYATAPAGAVGAGPVKPIRAYHGSPHDFDRFDISKIGTGEGAQAYGHGLYFAEKEGVARGYREGLAGKPRGLSARLDGAEDWSSAAPADRAAMSELWARVSPYKIETTDDVARIMSRAKSDLEKTIRNIDAGHVKVSKWDDEGYREALRLLNENRVTFTPPTTPGRMYEVDIHAPPDRFLDWDKPLSQQPQAVQDVANPFLKSQLQGVDRLPLSGMEKNDLRESLLSGNVTGNEFYRSLAGYNLGYPPSGPQNATARLAEAGIPGIKYLDAGSRAAGDGSRNYVVFDDSIVEILKKYGLAGLLPAAGMGLPPVQQQYE